MDETLHLKMKIPFLLMLLLTLVLVQSTSILASPETTLKVEPEINKKALGETFSITLQLDDVDNLYALDVSLRWDSQILRVVEVDVKLGVESHHDGVLHEPLFMLTNEIVQEEGLYTLVATSLGSETPAFNSSGSLAKIFFEVKQAGNCMLNLEATLVSKPSIDNGPSPIPHTVVDGFFTLEGTVDYPWLIVALVVVGLAALLAGTAIFRSRKRREAVS